MLALRIKSQRGDWRLRQEFDVTDIVEATRDAISVRRRDDSVTTHDLRDCEWAVVQK